MKTILCAFMLGLALPGALSGQVLTVNRLVPALAQSGEEAGERGEVALGCGRVAIGLPGAVNPKTSLACGGVALFDTKTGQELLTLFPPDADANAGMEFGYAVAISGSTLVIGAPGADETSAGNENHGALYVYDLKTKKFIGGKIQEVSYMFAGERFGQVVAVDGDWVAAASPQATGFAENASVPAGAVYLLHLPTGDDNLVSPDSGFLPGAVTGVAGDDFGAAIAMRGNLLVVGSPGATVSAQAAAGRVTVVSLRSEDVSVLVDEIDNPDPAGGENFGQVLALGSRHLMIGAPGDASGNGKLYIHEARTPLNMTETGNLAGTAPTDGVGTALATEGNRVFYRYGNYVLGQAFTTPFTASQTFATWEADAGDYGAASTVADGLLAVGAPEWNGSKGSVVLHETRQIETPDVYVSQLTGSTAPEHLTAGTTLADFVEVAANLQAPEAYPAASPLYIGKLAGPGAKTNPLAVYAYDSTLSQTQQIGVAEAASPLISRPIGNGVGRWWWRVTHKAGKRPNFSSSDGATPLQELHNGDGVLFGANLPLKVVDELRVDSLLDDAAFVSLRLKTGGALNAGNDSAILNMTPSDVFTHELYLRESTEVGGGVLAGEIAPRLALRDAGISFALGLSGTNVTSENNQTVFLRDYYAARRGDTAPGAKNAAGVAVAATFLTFTAESHNVAKGLFRATLKPTAGVTSAVNEALWSDRTDSIDLVLQKGQQAPGLPTGVKVTRFLNHAIMQDDNILILAQVGGPGVKAANDVLLYLSRKAPAEPGAFEILAREGDRLPGTKGAKIANILRLETAATNAGAGFNRYGLLCTLVTEAGRVTPADNLVWMIGDALPGSVAQTAVRQPLPKLRKGESSMIYGPGYERLISIAFPAVTRDVTGALITGMAHVIDPRHGGSTGVVTFPNKRKGVALIW